MKQTASLFFIAVLAPDNVSDEITDFKHYAATHFGSSRALRSPPHITLIPPFAWPAEAISAICSEVGQAVAGIPPFELILRNFSCFPPRVIFVDVPENEALNRLQALLAEHLYQTLKLGGHARHAYHPHLTVAFKDLRRKMFAPAWEYFSAISYQRSFEVRQIALLRHHNGFWEVIRHFSLNC